MKKVLGSVVIIAVALLLCANVFAQAASSSYDTPPQPEAKPTSGYDNGYFVGSADGDFKMTFGARVDPMFYWQNNNSPDNPATASITESQSEATFRLKRAQLSMTTKFKKFSTFVMVGHGTSGTRLDGAMRDTTYWAANGTYNFNDNFALEAGYEDPSYDFMSIVSSRKYTMVDYPITMTQQDGETPVWNMVGSTTITRPSFGLPTQLGMFLWTNFFGGKLTFDVSIGNGSEGTDKVAMNKRLTYTGRVSYTILGDSPFGDLTDFRYSESPALGVGLGGAFESDPGYGDDGSGATPSVLVKMYNWRADATADVAFRYRGFALTLSGLAARLKVGPGAVWEAGEKYLDDVGYLATVGMFAIPKKLEFQGWAAQIFREGPDNNVYEFGGGLNWYVYGPNAKFQVDYSRFFDYEDIRGSNHGHADRVRAKMQLAF